MRRSALGERSRGARVSRGVGSTLSIWRRGFRPNPACPVSRPRRAFWRASLSVRPIAMVSPTLFICVLSVVLAPRNFSKAKRGILTTV